MSGTIRLLLGLPLALLAACTISPPLAPYMALKQRCDRDAGAWFQAMHPAGVSHETVDTALRTSESTYTTHLAAHSQRCYLIVNEDTSAAYDDRDTVGRSERRLYEMGQQLPLAVLVARWPAPADQVDECRVLEKTCGSSDEWQRLVIAAWER